MAEPGRTPGRPQGAPPSLRKEGMGMALGACTLRHVQSGALKALSCLLISSVPQDVESFN